MNTQLRMQRKTFPTPKLLELTDSDRFHGHAVVAKFFLATATALEMAPTRGDHSFR